MKHRSFLAAISSLPFLGFLKPKPPWCVYTLPDDARVGLLGEALKPGTLIPTELEKDFDEYNGEAFVADG